MKKIRFLGFIIACILFFSPVKALAGNMKLTLVAGSNFMTDLGHSFLILQNNGKKAIYLDSYKISPGAAVSIGRRPGDVTYENGNTVDGIYINSEIYENKIDIYRKFSYISCDIDQKKLKTLMSSLKKWGGYQVVANNCTTAATVAGNKVCDKKLKVNLTNLPQDLIRQIKKMGGKNGTSLKKIGIFKKGVPLYDMFFMDNKGEIYPRQIRESFPNTTRASSKCIVKDGKYGVKVFWRPVKQVANKHTGKKYGNGYAISYKKIGASGWEKSLYYEGLNTNSATITGLQEGQEYEFNISPVSRLKIGRKFVDVYGLNSRTTTCVIKSKGKKSGQLKAGDIYTFGSYEQDNKKSNGKEPIEWIVLKKSGNNYLLISKYTLDGREYDKRWGITYDKSSLRKWLNTTFIQKAFSSAQRKKILRKTVKAEKNPDYGTPAGRNTKDKIFLLSITEARKYFKSKSARACKTTKYAQAMAFKWYSDHGYGPHSAEDCGGLWLSSGYCLWWLRSPGGYTGEGLGGESVSLVDEHGSVDSDGGSYLDDVCIGVRPALWIHL